MGSGGHRGVELLGHGPPRCDQVLNLAVGKSSGGQEEGQRYFLTVGVVGTAGNAMEIHIVKAQTEPVPEHRGCYFLVRNEQPSHILSLEGEAIVADRSPAVSDVGQFGQSVAGLEVFARGLQGQIGLILEPRVETHRPGLGLVQSGVVETTGPRLQVKISNWQEEIAPSVIVAWSVPVLERNLAGSGSVAFAKEPPVPPDLIGSVAPQREIIFSQSRVLFFQQKLALTRVFLVQAKDDALSADIASGRPLAERPLAQDQNVAVLAGLNHQSVHPDATDYFCVIFAGNWVVPIPDPNICGAAVLSQSLGTGHH